MAGDGGVVNIATLVNKIDALNREVDRLKNEVVGQEHLRDAARDLYGDEIVRLTAERDALKAGNNFLKTEVDRLKAEMKGIREDNGFFTKEHVRLRWLLWRWLSYCDRKYDLGTLESDTLAALDGHADPAPKACPDCERLRAEATQHTQQKIALREEVGGAVEEVERLRGLLEESLKVMRANYAPPDFVREFVDRARAALDGKEQT